MNKTFGRPRSLSPDALSRVLLLHGQGLGYRAIARMLRDDGIDAHFRTIARAVKGLPPYTRQAEPQPLTCCHVNIIRAINGMTQARLAAYLGVRPSEVARWERGIDALTDPAILQRLHHLATHFGFDLPLDPESLRLLREAAEILSLRICAVVPSR